MSTPLCQFRSMQDRGSGQEAGLPNVRAGTDR
jgi:hypothetical protein